MINKPRKLSKWNGCSFSKEAQGLWFFSISGPLGFDLCINTPPTNVIVFYWMNYRFVAFGPTEIFISIFSNYAGALHLWLYNIITSYLYLHFSVIVNLNSNITYIYIYIYIYILIDLSFSLLQKIKIKNF